MSSHEFAEWMAYESIEPGEPERSDLRFAIVAWAVAQWSSIRRKRGYSLKDFIVKFDKPKKGKAFSMRDLRVKMEAFASAHNAKIEQRRKKVKKEK